MKLESIEIIALISIILGLIVGYFFVYDFSPADSFFEEEKQNVVLTGKILSVKYYDLSNYTKINVETCRVFDVMKPGNLSIESLAGSNISFEGNLVSDALFVK